MDRDECWWVIAEQRRSLADLLTGLTDDQWERPSLCTGWRVRDVAAHVAMAPRPPGPARMLAGAVRARGDFDRLNHDLAVEHAAATPARLVEELREHADSHRRPVVTTRRNLLFDVLVHVQDIAVPLGAPQTMPLEAALDGLDRVWSMGWPFRARRRLGGLRLSATDVDWSAGSGAEGSGTQIRGPAQAMLLLLTGRADAARPQLSGPGLDRLYPSAAPNREPSP